MNITLVSFGSLLWNNKGLRISKFKDNGPFLPLEFSRISQDGRLTLVIDERSGRDNPTFHAKMKYNTLQKAIKALQTREKIKDENIDRSIGVVDVVNKQVNLGAQKYSKRVLDSLYQWGLSNKVDFIIFSALSVRFKDAINVPFSSFSAMAYLEGIEDEEVLNRAIEYIQKVPRVSTNFRELFEHNINIFE